MRPSGRGPSRKSWGGFVSGSNPGAGRQHAEVQQYQWSRQDRSDWDSVRTARPAVDGRGDPVEVWILEAPLDEMRPFALESEAPVYEDDE
jgi:hypothetical protein